MAEKLILYKVVGEDLSDTMPFERVCYLCGRTCLEEGEPPVDGKQLEAGEQGEGGEGQAREVAGECHEGHCRWRNHIIKCPHQDT